MKILIFLLSILISNCVHKKEKTVIITPTCPVTVLVKMENASKFDNKQVEIARSRCPHKFNGRSPCLVYFEKISYHNYKALCGKKVKSDP